jgi:glycosyltransferase involved in cell wall biosynthesis
VIVAFDATTLTGQLSGVGYYTARLMESLANGAGEGVLDHIVALSNKPIPRPGGDRVEVYEGGRFAVRSVWMQLVLPGILKRLQPDLVHYTNYLAPVWSQAPYVVSVHDMTLSVVPECHTLKKRLLTSRLLPHAVRGARLILTPSRSTRDDVVRILGVDAGRVRVIPYAASPGFRPTAGDHSRLERLYGARAPYFLYVGTLEPRKNLVRALRAFARIAPGLPDHRLLLVGQRGWKCRDILREAARPDLASRVVMAGYVPEEDLAALYSGATAFLYPSLYEGFGLPVIEAMACGAPVLTSRSSSLAEIADGAALLVDPLDERAIAAGLDALARDGALRAHLRSRGLARAATYSWDRTGRETVAAYREVTNDGRRGRPRSPDLTSDPDVAILRTVAYADLFQAPLTTAQLQRRLMDVWLEGAELRARLERPFLRERLAFAGDLVYLRGRDDRVVLRAERRLHTEALLVRHQRHLRALGSFPFVRLVALSGACAHENATDDDVDVFLMTRSGRAWSVMLALMVLSKLLGVRRSLCLNYVVDEEGARLPERDLFTAAEIVGMKPLRGREAYRRFVSLNAWVGARFPNFFAGHRESSEGVPEVGCPRWIEGLLDLGPAPLAEAVSRALLGRYLRRKGRGRPGVVLGPHRLKLHTDDHAPRLTAAFAEALRSLATGGHRHGEPVLQEEAG